VRGSSPVCPTEISKNDLVPRRQRVTCQGESKQEALACMEKEDWKEALQEKTD